MMLQNGANLINDSKTEVNLTSERAISALLHTQTLQKETATLGIIFSK
jgi:hypothetical protein